MGSHARTASAGPANEEVAESFAQPLTGMNPLIRWTPVW
jgi:hypothetical protein